MQDLGPHLTCLLLQKLTNSWKELNHLFFRGQLKQPSFTFEGPQGLLGSYRPGEIYIHPDLVLYNSWELDLIPVLKHEMTHQYIDQHLHTDEPPHGPVFKKLCSQIGGHCKAYGEIKHGPEVENSRPRPPHATLRRIEKLFNLAQSQNEHEAKAATAKAQQLLMLYNLDLPKNEQCRREDIPLDCKRTSIEVNEIASLITEFYGVDTVFYRGWDGQGLYTMHLAVMGRDVNVEVASYTYSFLLRVFRNLWKEYRLSKQGNSSRKVNLRQSRNAFIHGLASGFRLKLNDQRTTNAKQGLIWKGDPELIAFAKSQFPHTRARGFHAKTGDRRAYMQGFSEGKNINVHKAMHRPERRQKKFLTTKV